MKLRILVLAATTLALLPCMVLADGSSTDNQLLVEDVYPAWTQVHFEVEPGTWVTITTDEKSERITSLIFSHHGEPHQIPKPCLDDLRNPILETARIAFSGRGGAWVEFKTTTFDENGTGQHENDMAIVRFVVADGVLTQREIIQEKNNNYTNWAVVDLSKGLSKSDIDADRCGISELLPKVKVN